MPVITIHHPIDEHYWDIHIHVHERFSLSDVKDALPSIDSRLLPGAVGSIVSVGASQPFEVAKVKLQNYRPPTQNAVLSPPPSVLSTLRGVVSREGLRGVYAGLAPTLLMSVPNFVIYLITYDELVTYLHTKTLSTNHLQLPEPVLPFLCGASARLIATTAVAPLELLRTRHAASSGIVQKPTASTQVWNELSTILKTDGIRGLYKGLVPSLWRDVPFAAIYMVCLDHFKKTTQPFFQTSSDDVISMKQQIEFQFTNAALAGMVAASCTAPLDVVKTRLQSTRHGATTSTVSVLRSIVRDEGIKGLWRGNQARMLKVAPQYAIMISCYEIGKKMMA